MDLLIAKGATGDVGPDYWAIRGGKIGNWSGKVPLDRKELVGYAAYNDLPEVLEEFHRLGVPMDQLDKEGKSPIDIAVVYKSYRCLKYLLSLGYRPNPEIMKNVDSVSITKLYN